MVSKAKATRKERKFNEANGVIYMVSMLSLLLAQAGIDLPTKALAWEDDKGQTGLAYNDPANIAKRHGINNRAGIVDKMTGALNTMADKVIGQ